MLVGLPGFGKTTLWEATIGSARRWGARVLTARAAASTTELPFTGLIDLLDQVGESELAALPDIQRRALEVALMSSTPARTPGSACWPATAPSEAATANACRARYNDPAFGNLSAPRSRAEGRSSSGACWPDKSELGSSSSLGSSVCTALAIDPFLPSFVCPAEGEECYVVRGRQVAGSVEISLSRDLHRRHHHSEEYTPLELVAIKRFEQADTSGYRAYADRLEDAARYAARGELGYTVRTAADRSSVRVSLVARLLTESGAVRTELSHEHRFQDPDSQVTLVQAAEKAAELRALAQRLNENWSSLHTTRLLEIQAEYEQADAAAQAAGELQRIVESETD